MCEGSGYYKDGRPWHPGGLSPLQPYDQDCRPAAPPEKFGVEELQRRFAKHCSDRSIVEPSGDGMNNPNMRYRNRLAEMARNRLARIARETLRRTRRNKRG